MGKTASAAAEYRHGDICWLLNVINGQPDERGIKLIRLAGPRGLKHHDDLVVRGSAKRKRLRHSGDGLKGVRDRTVVDDPFVPSNLVTPPLIANASLAASVHTANARAPARRTCLWVLSCLCVMFLSLRYSSTRCV